MNRKLLYGCMHLGGSWDESPISDAQQAIANDILDFLIGDCTIRDFDHADIYCKGKSEKIFGNYFKKNGLKRDDYFIQSKCGIQLGVGALGSSHFCFDKKYIIDQVNQSIENLQCDYLDALLLHRPDPLWHPEEVAETFEYLKSQKLVHKFGVSNFSSSKIAYLKHYFPDIFANQVQFSLGHSHIIHEEVVFNTNHEMVTDTGFMTYHNLNDLEIQAWGPLDQGKYLADKVVNVALKNKIIELSKKYEVAAEAILIAWILKVPGHIVPILGSLQKDRMSKLLLAFEVDLSRQDWYDLWILCNEQKLP
jgi:predicted oxidoreductase